VTVAGPVYAQLPGLNGHDEIHNWAEQGVSAQKIFHALTTRNAKLLGLEDSLGSVDKGKRADLLLLTQNPLESVAAYDTIVWVIANGRPVARTELAAP